MENEILDDDLEFRKNSPDDYVEIINLKRAIVEEEKKVEHGKYALWFLMFITIIGAVYEISVYDEKALLLGIYIPIIVTYFVCAFLLKAKPQMSFIIVLSVYGLVQLIGMIGDPMLIVRGLLIKIIIVYYLAIAIGAAGKYEKSKSRLFDLGVD